MCGIVGYVGPRVATPLLIEGLKRLEYRGYDSAGVAIMNGKGVETRKAAGKISQLEQVVRADPVQGTMGIAHTRWATHGAPNHTNAHPHADCDETVAVVHNGIIENASALRQALEEAGHTFRSETDAARKGSPLLIGLGDGEYYVASDVSAILAHTRQVIYLDDGDLAVLEPTGFRVIDLNAV